MRDANRLRRLVWSGPAPAGVASRPRTRAASGLRPAATRGCLPGAWLTAAVRLARGFAAAAAHKGQPGGDEGEDQRPPQSAARCRRRTPDGAPEGATPSQGGVHIPTVAPPGAPSPPFSKGRRNETNSGASAPRERWRLDERSNQRVRRNLTSQTETPMIIRTEKPTTLPADVAEQLDISIQRA